MDERLTTSATMVIYGAGCVPGHLVRDIMLPEFSRRAFVPTPWLQATA